MRLGAEGSFGTSFDKIAGIELMERLLELSSCVFGYIYMSAVCVIGRPWNAFDVVNKSAVKYIYIHIPRRIECGR